jgi:hypothetical protein
VLSTTDGECLKDTWTTETKLEKHISSNDVQAIVIDECHPCNVTQLVLVLIFCRKVITLLSFRIFHQKRIMMPSNLFLCAISNSIQHLGYQLYIDLGILSVFSTKTNCCFMSFQTSFMNEKSLHRCDGVPCSMPWSLHIWSCYLL